MHTAFVNLLQIIMPVERRMDCAALVAQAVRDLAVGARQAIRVRVLRRSAMGLPTGPIFVLVEGSTPAGFYDVVLPWRENLADLLRANRGQVTSIELLWSSSDAHVGLRNAS